MKKKPSKKSPKDSFRGGNEFIKYTNVAIRMIVIILIGVFAGIKFDEYMGNENSYFTLILTILAVAASMYVIIRESSGNG